MTPVGVPRRILMTADGVGGVWNYALELSRALAAHDIRVTLAIMGWPLSPDQRRQAEACENAEIIEKGYKLEWMRDPWDDVSRAGRWLLELERQVQPDIVHLNGYSHGNLGWSAPKLIVGHSCVLSWWRAVHGGDAPPEWNGYRKAVTRGISSADMVAAPSRTMLDALQLHYGFSCPGRVVPNGRDPGCFRAGEKMPFIFSAGRLWDRAKNLSVLEDIALDLPWPVYVAGEEPRRAGSDANRSGIRLLGALSERQMSCWFAEAAVYAHPAYYEPFGLTILEAALSGCALVVGDIPSLRETWDGCAEFVSPGNAQALKKAIVRLCNDERHRLRLAAKSLAAARRLTPELMSAGYLRIYGDLMTSPAGRAGTGNYR